MQFACDLAMKITNGLSVQHLHFNLKILSFNGFTFYRQAISVNRQRETDFHILAAVLRNSLQYACTRFAYKHFIFGPIFLL